ncbi:hypothetical protein HDU96_007928 [Phlyctochytrium bullatum]|nr:hypothetical protein HDU96_007928 [Phlyctochytrium bullatum]
MTPPSSSMQASTTPLGDHLPDNPSPASSINDNDAPSTSSSPSPSPPSAMNASAKGSAFHLQNPQLQALPMRQPRTLDPQLANAFVNYRFPDPSTTSFGFDLESEDDDDNDPSAEDDSEYSSDEESTEKDSARDSTTEDDDEEDDAESTVSMTPSVASSTMRKSFLQSRISRHFMERAENQNQQLLHMHILQSGGIAPPPQAAWNKAPGGWGAPPGNHPPSLLSHAPQATAYSYTRPTYPPTHPMHRVLPTDALFTAHHRTHSVASSATASSAADSLPRPAAKSKPLSQPSTANAQDADTDVDEPSPSTPTAPSIGVGVPGPRRRPGDTVVPLQADDDEEEEEVTDTTTTTDDDEDGAMFRSGRRGTLTQHRSLPNMLTQLPPLDLAPAAQPQQPVGVPWPGSKRASAAATDHALLQAYFPEAAEEASARFPRKPQHPAPLTEEDDTSSSAADLDTSSSAALPPAERFWRPNQARETSYYGDLLSDEEEEDDEDAEDGTFDGDEELDLLERELDGEMDDDEGSDAASARGTGGAGDHPWFAPSPAGSSVGTGSAVGGVSPAAIAAGLDPNFDFTDDEDDDDAAPPPAAASTAPPVPRRPRPASAAYPRPTPATSTAPLRPITERDRHADAGLPVFIHRTNLRAEVVSTPAAAGVARPPSSTGSSHSGGKTRPRALSASPALTSGSGGEGTPPQRQAVPPPLATNASRLAGLALSLAALLAGLPRTHLPPPAGDMPLPPALDGATAARRGLAMATDLATAGNPAAATRCLHAALQGFAGWALGVAGTGGGEEWDVAAEAEAAVAAGYLLGWSLVNGAGCRRDGRLGMEVLERVAAGTGDSVALGGVEGFPVMTAPAKKAGGWGVRRGRRDPAELAAVVEKKKKKKKKPVEAVDYGELQQDEGRAERRAARKRREKPVVIGFDGDEIVYALAVEPPRFLRRNRKKKETVSGAAGSAEGDPPGPEDEPSPSVKLGRTPTGMKKKLSKLALQLTLPSLGGGSASEASPASAATPSPVSAAGSSPVTGALSPTVAGFKLGRLRSLRVAQGAAGAAGAPKKKLLGRSRSTSMGAGERQAAGVGGA